MSTRAMVFIDGTWLAVTANRLAEQHGLQGRTGGPLDFGALPRVCAQDVAAQMALSTGIDVVRTYYFGSIATNYDAQDADAVQRRGEFFDGLRRHHRYEVHRFETDYRGHRVRRTPGDDGFSPPEKAVDVGLATALLEMAAVSAYDIAIVVCGDRDFVPALQAVRRLGKRVAIVSARGSCARELSDPNDPMRLRDFDVLWLDQAWAQVVSPAARPTTRATAEEGPEPLLQDVGDDSPYAHEPSMAMASAAGSGEAVSQAVSQLEGVITKVHAHGYGFVRADDGLDYYFRRADFGDAGAFGRLERYRTRVAFRVSEPSRAGQAGRATMITVIGVADAAMRDAAMREATGSPDGAVSSGARRGAHEPTTPADGVAAVATAGDLWADDPFAAPRRRQEPSMAKAPAPVAEPVAGPVAEPAPTLVAAVAPDAPAIEVAAADPVVVVSANAEAPASVAAPPRKRRATRKTLPA